MPHSHAVILLIAIASSVVAGVAAGWFGGPALASQVSWMGELFLDALKMLVVPLLMAAVISGIAALGDPRRLGRVGGLTLLYYFATTGIAVFFGLVAVNLVQPGVGLNMEGFSAADSAHFEEKSAGLADIILSMVAPNLVQAMADGQMLPLIVFAIAFGLSLVTLGEQGRPMLDVIESLNAAMMRLVIWLMYLSPLGIFGLVAGRLGQAGGEAFFAQLQAVGVYVLTVLGALGVHAAFLFLVLYFVTGRGFSYVVEVGRALMTAFGTASSSATLPLTMECVKEAGVDPRATRVVLPLGSTVNMDGTALYEAVAVLFIAQAYGIDLTMGQQVLVFVTATLAAVGAAGIPEAGLVTMVIVLQAVGLPLEGIGLLLAVDWFLDRFRTTVNVWGDSVGAAVIAKTLPKED